MWYGGRTYAQHGDDLVIANMFTSLGIANPSYLDIGAHHPEELSNTALLYKRGSRGINVEANPNLMAAFARMRPGDINLNVGVAGESGTLKFYCDGPTSGRNSFVRELVEPIGIRSEMMLPVTTCDEIVRLHAGGVFPDLLTIDAEGLDFEILSSINYAEGLDFEVLDYLPKVICAEVVECFPESMKIPALLTASGYKPHFRAGSNLIFIRNDLAGKML